MTITGQSTTQIGDYSGDPYWWDRAACRTVDPEVFFGFEHSTGSDRASAEYEAKRVCARCPVRSDCLREALSGNERFGIWGGLTLRERRKLVRQQSARADR